MVTKLQANRRIIPHPGASGQATETNWREMLQSYLPARYQVSDGFVIDADGSLSQQIDVIIFDRQYSPLLFNQDNVTYIPAESIYAIFEVKQKLSRETIGYASDKVASVRRLRRTSAPIPHVGGVFEPKPPFPIIGGILTLESSWHPHPPLGKYFRQSLTSLDDSGQLNLGCALKHRAFEANYENGILLTIEESREDTALVFFMFRLLALLQRLGTVSAIDFSEYTKDL